MKTVASAMLAAITLAGPTLAVAGGNPTDARAKPSSYVSRPHTNRHIYGSPIEPPIVGRAAAPHYTHAHNTRHAAPRAMRTKRPRTVSGRTLARK
jgi:hypothetical protein